MSEKEPNFTLQSTQESKSDYKIKMSVDNNIENFANLSDDKIIADLDILAKTHPEIFK